MLDSGLYFLATLVCFFFVFYFLLFLCKEKHCYNFAISGRLIFGEKMPQNSDLE